jgi:CBS domain-containing protein
MRPIRHLLVDKPVLAVDVGASALDAARYMSERVIGAVPVLDQGRLVGMFTERDLMSRVVVPGRDVAGVRVGEVMTRDIVIAHPDDLYSTCIASMKQVHCRHLPVVEGGRLLGTISLRDLLAEGLKEREAEVRFLTDYVQVAPPGAERRDRAG